MNCAPMVPIGVSTSSSNSALVPEAKWVITYLPTSPPELESPLACLPAADMAPAVIDAGGATLEVGRVHADRGGHHADAGRLEALEPDLPVLEGLHRRHRIGLALGPPQLLGAGVAGDADVLRHPVVIGR